MKFKNVSKGVKQFKIDGVWVNVKPGEMFNVNKTFGRLHLDKDLLKIVEEPQEGDLVEEETPEEEEAPVDEPEEGTADMVEDTVESPVLKTRDELKKMTRDELNDYASDLGFKNEIKTRLLKSVMINKIVKLQSNL